MFGSVFTMKALPGQEDALRSFQREWDTNRRPKIAGFVASYILASRDRPGEFIGVAVFDSEESYRANASAPEQHEMYLKLRALLAEDPVWNDGDVVAASS